MVMPPEHLSYFTPKTIDFLMSKNKFRKVFSRTENISIYRIIEFINKRASKSSITSAKMHMSPQKISDNLQKITESNLITRFVKKMINIFLDFFNLGSSMKVLYKK